MNDEEMKKVLKEAIKEWLDAQFSYFGRISMTAILAAAFGAGVYFVLISSGWVRK